MGKTTGHRTQRNRKLRELDASDVAAVKSLSEDDPVRSLIESILSVVPVSHWIFARFKGYGDANVLLTSVAAQENREQEFRQTRSEFVLQRRVAAQGPRLAATIMPLRAPYSSGLAMLFADNRHDLGMLTLWRTDALGAFTSVEIRALALALDAAADLLMPFPLAQSTPPETLQPQVAVAQGRQIQPPTLAVGPEMLVLDADLNIVFNWDDETKSGAVENRLPPMLERTVRNLTSGWTTKSGSRQRGVARPLPFLVVRTQPLQGLTGMFVGVLLDRVRRTRSLSAAIEEFGLSRRESQTLAFLLGGASLLEICDRMHITSSTVQDHIKSLISKTRSRNRSEMIAKALGWEALTS